MLSIILWGIIPSFQNNFAVDRLCLRDFHSRRTNPRGTDTPCKWIHMHSYFHTRVCLEATCYMNILIVRLLRLRKNTLTIRILISKDPADVGRICNNKRARL